MADRHSQELALAQLEILKADAQGNWFQSSWRPLIGWIGGISLGINYMVAPIAMGFGFNIPQADMSVMMPLLLGMIMDIGSANYVFYACAVMLFLTIFTVFKGATLISD